MTKTQDLIGAELDAAVALAQGWIRTRSRYDDKPELWDTGGGFYRVEGPIAPGSGSERWAPSTHWNHGGPIIEREGIDIETLGRGEGWRALVNPDSSEHYCLDSAEGPTPLIAAMRAYVASKS